MWLNSSRDGLQTLATKGRRLTAIIIFKMKMRNRKKKHSMGGRA